MNKEGEITMNGFGMILFLVTALVSALAFFISYRQFNEKGYLFNNAYIYASRSERESMDMSPHYRQSAIVFMLIGVIFLLMSLNMLIPSNWLFIGTLVVVFVAICYAIVSSIKISRKQKRQQVNKTR